MRSKLPVGSLALLGILALLTPRPAPAQAAPARRDTTRIVPDSARRVAKLAPLAVTATRNVERVFRTANPVLAIDSSVVRQESPNGIGDLFRNLPGVDVTGVGPNQTRLMIRGQRGQRILLAEDGVRLNNSRRQQDFGELPAMTDVNNLNRVEVVRGPASVLYGTDAIGGVVNQITTRAPGWGAATGMQGSLAYRYGSADGQNLVHGRVTGRTGRFGIAVTAGYRDASAYNAPAGTFGNINLEENAKVNDTGVIDRTLGLDLTYDFSERSALSLRVSNYAADDAGFGYVDPAAIGDTSGVLVRLLYPEQDVTRATLNYRATAVSSAFADRFGLTAYTTQNDRTFVQQIDLNVFPIPPFPPGAGIKIRSRNVTDIATYGFRAEAAKVLAGRHTVTYGVDWYIDQTENKDSSLTTTTTFGPPRDRVSTTPTLPNASLWSGGIFAQAEFALGSKFVLGAGMRGQTIQSETKATAGLPETRAGVKGSNGALVGSLSGNWNVIPELSLIGTMGRAFRAANLVEKYFDGATPEGNGYLVANPDLDPETSLNFDVGAKFRKGRFYAEVIYFTNTISDGIRLAAIPDSVVGQFPAYENQNIEKVRDQGIEVLSEVVLGRGFAVLGHYTDLSSKNVDNPNFSAGDSYSSKIGGELSWRDTQNRFFAAYEVRHNGERKDINLTAAPVGDRLPPFTVHNIRGAVRLPTFGTTATTLNLAVLNLTDELYAEASNTSFFRPEPRRSVVATLRFDF
ncbi:MAG TPA: TonB-dependent receptor [Gemmatimonadales bacterium]